MSGKKLTDGVLPLPKLTRVLEDLNNPDQSAEVQRLQRFLVRRCKFIFASYMRHLCAAVETLGNLGSLPDKFSLEDFISELAEGFEETREREHKTFAKHLFVPKTTQKSGLSRNRSEDDLATGQTNLNSSSFVLDHLSEAAVFLKVLFGESLSVRVRDDELMEVSPLNSYPLKKSAVSSSPSNPEIKASQKFKTPTASPSGIKKEDATFSPKKSPGENQAAYINRGKEKLAVAEALYESKRKERAERSRSPTSPALMRSPIDREGQPIVTLAKATPKKTGDSGSKSQLQKTSPSKLSSPSGWRDLLGSQMKVSLEYSQSEDASAPIAESGFSGKKELRYLELEYPNGKYFGTVDSSGKRAGKGRYEWADGSVYVGEWANDLREGEGTFTWANGDSYSGAYSADKREGLGTHRSGYD